MRADILEKARAIYKMEEEIDRKATKALEMVSLGLIEKPKGVSRKTCPECGQRLLKKSIRYGWESVFDYYECSCGYEYAKVDFSVFRKFKREKI